MDDRKEVHNEFHFLGSAELQVGNPCRVPLFLERRGVRGKFRGLPSETFVSKMAIEELDPGAFSYRSFARSKSIFL